MSESLSFFAGCELSESLSESELTLNFVFPTEDCIFDYYFVIIIVLNLLILRSEVLALKSGAKCYRLVSLMFLLLPSFLADYLRVSVMSGLTLKYRLIASCILPSSANFVFESWTTTSISSLNFC